jgi:hypothetical protein
VQTNSQLVDTIKHRFSWQQKKEISKLSNFLFRRVLIKNQKIGKIKHHVASEKGHFDIVKYLIENNNVEKE